MLRYWRSWLRITSWTAIYVFVLFIIAELTGSWLAVTLSGLSLLIIWVFIVNVGEICKGRKLKEFLATVAEEKDVPEDWKLIRGHLYFSNHMYTAVISASKEGVFVYSVGICAYLIPWKSISSIKIVGPSHLVFARIRFARYPGKEISISWEDDFKSLVPDEVRVIF